MAFDKRDLDDYVDVAQRIADFRALYPNGCLQAADPAQPYRVMAVPNRWCVQCIGRRQVKNNQGWQQCPRCDGSGVRRTDEPQEDIFIVYVAVAIRGDGSEPGWGAAWEPYPGRTPYTSASELMNAETSAWGRAIIAALAGDSKPGIASRQEVRNRAAERDDGLPVNADGTVARSQLTEEQRAQAGIMTKDQVKEHTQLRKLEHPRPAERVSGPLPDDQWTAPDATPPEERPGSSSLEQQRMIATILAGKGITTREGKLAFCSQSAGRPVGSSKELSFQEAIKVMNEADALGTVRPQEKESTR